MNWIEDNLAVMSGIIVPLLLGIVKPVMERDYGYREVRRITKYAQLRCLLKDGTEAAYNIDSLLSMETKNLVDNRREQTGRKIDVTNLIAIILVSLIGGAISFSLVTWAQSVSGVWSGLLWVVFAVWTLFVVLLVFVGGLSNFYKRSDNPIARDES
jgi:hypothetical protein